NVFTCLAELGSNVSRCRASTQTVQCSANHVVWVAGTQALGYDVAHAHHFEDSAHWATGDNTSTFSCGRDQNGGCTVLTNYGVMQGAVFQRHFDQAATGLFHCLLNSNGYFAGFALTHADTTIAVTDHGQRSKAHGATTLNHFADAVDRNHFFFQAIIALLLWSLSALCFSHLIIPLEFQAGFTRGLGQRFHAAMVTEARAVESNRLDTRGLRLFGDALANEAGGRHVAANGQFFANLGLGSGSTDQNAVAFGRDDARVNMRIRAVHRQAVYAQLGDLAASSHCTTHTGLFLV